MRRAEFFVPSVTVLVMASLTIWLVLTGCSLSDKQATLSPDHAPLAQGAIFHTESPNSDGTPMYTYRAWKPGVEFELINKEKCLLEIENVPADKMQVVFEGDDGRIDPALAGIEIKRPLSTKITAAIPKGLKGKILLELSEKWGREGSFAVIGDTQGNNEAFETAISQINMVKPDFVVHVGDMTASGREEEVQNFLQTSKESFCPIYTVPGNHDVKSGRIAVYQKWLAPADYSFDWGGNSLVFLDNSSGGITEEQFSYLKNITDAGKKIIIFMHIPPVDPRGNSKDHEMTDKVSANTFLTLMQIYQENIRGVFNGHVHMYDQYQKNGVQFVTTGGGGADLYAEPAEGGYNHWVLVSDPSGNSKSLKISVEKFDPPPRRDILTLKGPQGTLILDNQELQELYNSFRMEGTGAFINQYGNTNGQGTYSGILIHDLLKQVGGMSEDNELIVSSSDGYQQMYAYGNVYPEKVGWQEKQGDMVLALSCDGQGLPRWKDGYRIVFLTPDGIYENKDCEMTSAPGQGWNEYQSAGARWIRYVVKMEVK